MIYHILFIILCQITIYFARWVLIRVPRSHSFFVLLLVFDFFYKHLTHREYCYHDNTVTKSARNCFKNILCQILPVNCPREVTKLNFWCVSRKSFLMNFTFKLQLKLKINSWRTRFFVQANSTSQFTLWWELRM